jgi:hypothetical protein
VQNPVPIAGSVAVTNPLNTPLVVRDVAQPRQRRHQAMHSFEYDLGFGRCTAEIAAPTNERVILEWVAIERIEDWHDAHVEVVLYVRTPGEYLPKKFPLQTFSTVQNVGKSVRVNQQLLAYVEPGDTYQVCFYVTGQTTPALPSVVVTGHRELVGASAP